MMDRIDVKETPKRQVWYGQPLATRDLLIDVAEHVRHGDLLEEVSPWLWGDEIEAFPIFPNKADGPLKTVLGSTALEGQPE